MSNLIGDYTEKKTEKKTEKNEKISYTIIFLIVIVVSLIVNTASLYIYDRYMAPKVYVYDLKAFVKDQREKFAKGMIDEKEFENNLRQLDLKIKSLPDNAVVITRDVILKGGIEIE